MKIREIYKKFRCRQILTSKGYPTVEVELVTPSGIYRSSCPAGQSTGKKEAKFLIDNGKQYMGKAVGNAVFNVKNLVVNRIENIFEFDVHDQKAIDNFLIEMDGTENLGRLGANAILPISLSFCKAAAGSLNYDLFEYISKISDLKMGMPKPCFNILNGGLHAGNNLKFQEIMICFDDKKFANNLEKAVIFYDFLKKVIQEKYGIASTNVGDEGGFAPPVNTLEQALDLVIEAYENSGLQGMGIAIDAASSSFYKDRKYCLDKEMDSIEYISYLVDILKKYELIFMLEDPLAEDDYDGWRVLKEKTDILIMGDDLTVTNSKLIEMADEQKLCNAILIKPNQNGTVTGTISAIKEAKKRNMKICVSHRSSETEDTFIADLAVGVGADYVKFGAPCRGERIAKYNQLLRIEYFYGLIVKNKK